MEDNQEEQPVEFFTDKDVLGLDTRGPAVQDIHEASVEAPEERDLYEGLEFPSIMKRIQAVFVDVLVMLLVFAFTAQMIGLVGDVPTWVRAFVLIFMVFVYEPVCISLFAGTLGHYLIGLRVKRRSNPNRNIHLVVAIFRFFLKSFLGWLSFLTVSANKQKRAIHDMASGSIVLPKSYFPHKDGRK